MLGSNRRFRYFGFPEGSRGDTSIIPDFRKDYGVRLPSKWTSRRITPISGRHPTTVNQQETNTPGAGLGSIRKTLFTVALAADSSRTTHASVETVEACRLHGSAFVSNDWQSVQAALLRRSLYTKSPLAEFSLSPNLSRHVSLVLPFVNVSGRVGIISTRAISSKKSMSPLCG